MRRNEIIEELENAQLKDDLPEFGPGDTVVVRCVSAKGPENACRPSKAW